MSLALEQVERRLYLRGDTYPLRERIRAAGGRWDPARRAWFLALAQRELAELLVSRTFVGDDQEQGPAVRASELAVLGRARYEGRVYFLLEEQLQEPRPAVRLAYRDGSRAFWARSPGSVEVLARYAEPRTPRELRAAEALLAGGRCSLCAHCGGLGACLDSSDRHGVLELVCEECAAIPADRRLFWRRDEGGSWSCLRYPETN